MEATDSDMITKADAYFYYIQHKTCTMKTIVEQMLLEKYGISIQSIRKCEEEAFQ